MTNTTTAITTITNEGRQGCIAQINFMTQYMGAPAIAGLELSTNLSLAQILDETIASYMSFKANLIPAVEATPAPEVAPVVEEKELLSQEEINALLASEEPVAAEVTEDVRAPYIAQIQSIRAQLGLEPATELHVLSDEALLQTLNGLLIQKDEAVDARKDAEMHDKMYNYIVKNTKGKGKGVQEFKSVSKDMSWEELQAMGARVKRRVAVKDALYDLGVSPQYMARFTVEELAQMLVDEQAAQDEELLAAAATQEVPATPDVQVTPAPEATPAIDETSVAEQPQIEEEIVMTQQPQATQMTELEMVKAQLAAMVEDQTAFVGKIESATKVAAESLATSTETVKVMGQLTSLVEQQGARMARMEETLKQLSTPQAPVAPPVTQAAPGTSAPVTPATPAPEAPEATPVATRPEGTTRTPLLPLSGATQAALIADGFKHDDFFTVEGTQRMSKHMASEKHSPRYAKLLGVTIDPAQMLPASITSHPDFTAVLEALNGLVFIDDVYINNKMVVLSMRLPEVAGAILAHFKNDHAKMGEFFRNYLDLKMDPTTRMKRGVVISADHTRYIGLQVERFLDKAGEIVEKGFQLAGDAVRVTTDVTAKGMEATIGGRPEELGKAGEINMYEQTVVNPLKAKFTSDKAATATASTFKCEIVRVTPSTEPAATTTPTQN